MNDNLTIFKEIAQTLAKLVSQEQFTKAVRALKDFLVTSELKLMERIDARLSKISDGKDGKDGAPGPQGPKGDKGERGATFIAMRGENGAPGKDGSPDTGNQIIDKINNEATNLISRDAVEGLDKLEEQIKQIEIRPVRVGGGAKGFTLYVDGTRKLLTAQTLNLIAGTGMTLSYSYANGRNDITFTATGSASINPIVVTGAIDNSNTSFTAASAPNLVIVNGASYRDGHGCSITGTAITLDNPVGNGGDIYAL